MVGHLVVGWDPVERAWVVIHTYSGRLGLTITPKKSGVGEGNQNRRKVKKKFTKDSSWRSGGRKRDGRARIPVVVRGDRGGEHVEVWFVGLEVFVLLFCVFVLLAHRVGSLFFCFFFVSVFVSLAKKYVSGCLRVLEYFNLVQRCGIIGRVSFCF